MTRKKKDFIPENNTAPGVESRLSYGPFFSAMFKTFGYTLLVFMGFLLVIFLIMWLMKG